MSPTHLARHKKAKRLPDLAVLEALPCREPEEADGRAPPRGGALKQRVIFTIRRAARVVVASAANWHWTSGQARPVRRAWVYVAAG
jgi:hypothetical protein